MDPRPDTVKVTRESLNRIKVGPWDPSEVITQDSEDKPSPSKDETQPSPTAEPVPRSVRITQERLEKFGFAKGCPKCEALRRGDEHKSVHHNTVCRKRIDSDMSRDDLLSKKLSDVEEKKKGYLARRVEASDRERVDATSTPSRGKPVDSGASAVPGDESETVVEILTPGATAVTGVEPGVSGIPPSTSESRLCNWIECSHDRRTWAEVQEEEQRERVDEGLSSLLTLPFVITNRDLH